MRVTFISNRLNKKQMSLFQKLLLLCGYSIVLVWGHIAYTTVTKKDIRQSIYMSGDIAHVDYKNLTVYFENGGDPLEFSNITEIKEYIEKITAYASSIHGYKENLDWLVSQGYIYATTHHNENKQYTELIYNGPNWTVDAAQDTTYIISTFNHVEKIFDPKTKSIEYDHYSID